MDTQQDTTRNTVEGRENILARGHGDRDTRGRLPLVLLEVNNLDPSLCTKEGGGESDTEVDNTEAGCTKGAGFAVRDVFGEEAGQEEVQDDGGEEVHQAEVGHQHHGRLVPPLVEGFVHISPGESAAEQLQHEDKAVEADTEDQDLV